jgi:glycosyltransferase involved in cell wall biosynthesis
MRVLLLSDWNTNRGGAERYIVSLRDGLRIRGDEAMLVSCGARSVDTTPSDARVYGSDFPPAQAFLQIVNPVAGSSIRRHVKAFKPDVAVISQFAYHLSPASLNAVRGIPHVITTMDYKSICPLGTRVLPDGTVCTQEAGISCRDSSCVGFAHWMRDIPRYNLIRKCVSRASRVLCPTEWMVRQFAQQGISAESVPLGAENPSEHFARKPAAHPKFVYSGRLSAEKGVTLLIRAFAKFVRDIPHASLTLVGDGPLRQTIERQIRELDLARSVSITGWDSPARVDTELSDAWALVAPSIWAEPFGLAVVEAMMRGVPVVASNRGGFAENVDDCVTGLLVEPGDEASLIQGLRRIASRSVFVSGSIDPSYVARAREQFNLDAHIDRMRALLVQVAQSSRASA